MSRTSVAELFERHPFDHDVQDWYGSRSVTDTIIAADELHLADDPVSYLDNLLKDDRSRAIDIRRSLLALPPAVVVGEFGLDVATWSAMTSVLSGEADDMKATLERDHGMNLQDLENARLWLWHQEFASSGKRVLGQYGLIQAMRSGSLLEDVDLERILQDCSKTDKPLSPTRISDYSLRPVEAEVYNSYYDGGTIKGWDEFKDQGIIYGSWIDAPTGFALTYKGKIQAMAGIALAKNDELMHYQVQGAYATKVDTTKSPYDDDYVVGRISARGLAPLDWQKVLVDTTEQIARDMALPSVGIQAGKNNVWTKKRMPRDTEPHLPLAKAEIAYDGLAKRLGYRQLKRDTAGNWHKRTGKKN